MTARGRGDKAVARHSCSRTHESLLIAMGKTTQIGQVPEYQRHTCVRKAASLANGGDAHALQQLHGISAHFQP